MIHQVLQQKSPPVHSQLFLSENNNNNEAMTTTKKKSFGERIQNSSMLKACVKKKRNKNGGYSCVAYPCYTLGTIADVDIEEGEDSSDDLPFGYAGKFVMWDEKIEMNANNNNRRRLLSISKNKIRKGDNNKRQENTENNNFHHNFHHDNNNKNENNNKHKGQPKKVLPRMKKENWASGCAISHKYKFIYKHVLKSGGTSIKVFLRGAFCGEDDEKCEHNDKNVITTISCSNNMRNKYPGYFIWSFVRDPFSREYSTVSNLLLFKFQSYKKKQPN